MDFFGKNMYFFKYICETGTIPGDSTGPGCTRFPFIQQRARQMLKLREGFKGQRIIVLPKFLVEEFQKDRFTAKLHLTDIGYYPNAEYHFCRRENGAKEYIFVLCQQGSGWLEMDGMKYAIGQNQFFVIPPGVKHSYGADKTDPWSIYWVHFSGDFAGSYAKCKGPGTIYQTAGNKISDVIKSFEQMYQTLLLGYSRDNIHYVISCLYGFLGSVAYMSVKRDAESTLDSRNSINSIDSVISYMKEHIELRLDTHELSERTGCNSAILAARFKRETGYTLRSYFNHLKIQEACHYLDNTDMTVSQICFKIGLNDALYFSRLFSRITGVCPRDYRKRIKG